MHNQVNFIKFFESWKYNIISYVIYITYDIFRVESNKFDNIYNKIGNIFVGSNF